MAVGSSVAGSRGLNSSSLTHGTSTHNRTLVTKVKHILEYFLLLENSNLKQNMVERGTATIQLIQAGHEVSTGAYMDGV